MSNKREHLLEILHNNLGIVCIIIITTKVFEIKPIFLGVFVLAYVFIMLTLKILKSLPKKEFFPIFYFGFMIILTFATAVKLIDYIKG